MITKEQIKEQLQDPEWNNLAREEDQDGQRVWTPMWGVRIITIRNSKNLTWSALAIEETIATEICYGVTFELMEEAVKNWLTDEIYNTLKQSKQ